MSKKKQIHSMDDYAYQSPIRSQNPKLKVCFAVAVLLLCIWADRLAVSLYIAVTMAVFNIRFNRLPIREYIGLMTIPLAFLIMGCAAIAVDVGYGTTGWYLHVTRESILLCLNVMMRAFGAVSAVYFMTLSTPICEVIGVLGRLHLPKIIIELMYMIYRYIFIMLDAQCRAKMAAESRLGYIDFKTSCKSFGNSLGNLLVVSLKKSSMYYDAMVSRGYDGELRFWEDEKPLDGKALTAVLCYAATILTMWMLIK